MEVLRPVLVMKILCPRNPIGLTHTGPGAVSRPSFTRFAFNDPMKNQYFFFTKRKSKPGRGKIFITSCTARSSQDWNPGLSDFLYALSL